MKNMSPSRWIAAFVLVSFFSSPVFALDVIGKGSLYIKVSAEGKNRKFELCDRQKSAGECRLLGERSYRRSELVNLRDKLVTMGLGTSVITGLAIYPVYVAVGVGLATITATPAAGVLLVGGPGGAMIMAGTSKYAPWNMFKRARMIRDEVIEDADVLFSGSDDEMKDLAWELDRLLKELD